MAEVTHDVLVVDDEEHVLRSIQRLLRPDGYKVHVATGGAAGLDILEREDIAVIICDQRMPGMSGAEVLTQVYLRRPDTVRITLTGYTDLAAAQASINDGHVHHFLTKPWDDDHLRSLVRDGVRAYELILDNRRLERVTREQKEELEEWNRRLEAQVAQRTEQLSAQNERLRRLQCDVEQSLRDTVRVMAGMLEASNPNLGIHSKRVAERALALATDLNLTGDDLRDVEFAGQLHDIGKISKLHSGERKRPQGSGGHGDHRAMRHSDSGHAILSHVSGFGAISEAVHHQYECYDGTGHPDRLKEDEIPIISRIISIADTYDDSAFSSSSPTASSREAGKKALLAGCGTRFDPALVEVFIGRLKANPLESTSESEVELPPSQLRAGMVLSREIRNGAGVLLLSSDSHLTDETIERIQLASNLDPVLGGVFVKSTQDVRSNEQHAASADGAVPTVPATRESEQRAPDAKVKRALIVDDESSVRGALRRELRRVGWDTLCVGDGRAAQSILECERFDLLLVDVAMPIMSGDLLIAHVEQCWPDLPCIVLTGHVTRDQLLRITQASVVRKVLTKPWDFDKLVHAINAATALQPTGRVGESV